MPGFKLRPREQSRGFFIVEDNIMCLKERNLWVMAILSVITCGLYFIYWLVKTKNEITCLGAEIPTAFLVIIPIANIYFWYKYAQGFTDYIKKNGESVAYFLLLLLLPMIGMLVVQAAMNKAVRHNQML